MPLQQALGASVLPENSSGSCQVSVKIRYSPDIVATPVCSPGKLRTISCVRHQSSIVLTPPTRRIITRNTKINKVWITDSAATSVNELPTHRSNT